MVSVNQLRNFTAIKHTICNIDFVRRSDLALHTPTFHRARA